MQELTIEELKDRIVSVMDTTDLLEQLQISIEELVEAFSDKIEEHYEQLIEELSDDESGED